MLIHVFLLITPVLAFTHVRSGFEKNTRKKSANGQRLQLGLRMPCFTHGDMLSILSSTAVHKALRHLLYLLETTNTSGVAWG